MITDRIGRHEVLLPINHNFNKTCNIIGYFLNQNTRNSTFCFANSEKKSHLSARVMARIVQLGTLSEDDDNGSENVVKKMNLRSFKLNRVYLVPLNMSNAGDFSWS